MLDGASHGGLQRRGFAITQPQPAPELAHESTAALIRAVHLDEGNGVDAIVELRWRLGDLPAVLITADRSPRVRNAARTRDIRVLHKPLKPAALRAVLAQWRVQRVAAE